MVRVTDLPGECRYGVLEEEAGPEEDFVSRTPVFEQGGVTYPSYIWCWEHRMWATEGVHCQRKNYGKEERA